MSVSGRAVGVARPQRGAAISTEQAVNAFGIAAGVFGGLAGFIAARRLAGLDREIRMGELILPVLVAGTSTVVGAFLLPSAN